MNNVLSPTNATTLLVGDTAQASSQAPFDQTVRWTKVGQLYASACAEFQSASGGVLFPRMTQAQIDALPLAGQSLVAGTMIYNTTTNSMVTYLGGTVPGFATGSTVVKGTLTAANIDGMFAAPVLVVPAAPAGYVNVVETFILNYVRVASFAGGGAISLEYDNTAAAGGTLATGTIPAVQLTAASNTYAKTSGAALTSLSAPISGAPLYISNATAAFTLGAGSTVNYTVIFRILPIT